MITQRMKENEPGEEEGKTHLITAGMGLFIKSKNKIQMITLY